MGTLRIRKIAAIVGLVFAWMFLLLLHIWATLAIYFANYRHPLARTLLPIIYVLVLILLVILVRRPILRLLAVFVAFILVILWWICIQPTGAGDYLPPVQVKDIQRFHEDLLTILNFANFNY